ncbi:acyl-CoA:lysophosphatidylglycerol acyltransferase 1-like [Liolophura sinensis]|uniref:acyl-CoA:lysophosphatidylglycerol acyltransferase 1-like n=1 Tax=Liolophura sinensis TaxID=3198878 RepID=UPI00315887C1
MAQSPCTTHNMVYNFAKYTIRILFTLATNFYSIPAYLVWMFVLWPLRIVHPKLYWAVEAFLFNGLLSMVVAWLGTAGYTIVEAGDDVSSLYEKEVVLLANHQSTADVPILMAAVHPKRTVGGKVMWIMDMLFKYTNFGAVSTLRGDFFIQQGKLGRQEQLVKLKNHLTSSYIPTDKKWVVIFPEGGFLRKRRVASQQYAKKNGYPVLEHVTLPRIGALQVVLDTLSNQDNSKGFTLPDGSKKKPLEWLIDLTIAYPNGRPLDLHGICIGYWPACNIVLHYKAYRVKDIPRDPVQLLKWLYDRFEEKEAFLEAYYMTGKVPVDTKSDRELPQKEPHSLQQDIMGVALFHVFYLASTYLHYCLLYKPILSLFLITH